jgi:hypothetical protein
VVFSVAANRRFQATGSCSIRRPGAPENHWMGVTFRTSRTTVHLRDGQAYLADDTPLTLATGDQRREFFRLRSRENNETDFTYPRITYTISESDRMPPAPPEPIAAKDK